MKPYYSEDGIVIYHGDCRDVLPLLERSDMLCTDPPYGIGAARKETMGFGDNRGKNGMGGKNPSKRDYGDSAWDDSPADATSLAKAISMTDWQVIFGGNYFDLPKARCWLIWDKLRGDTDYADGEMAWTNLDKAVRIIRWRWNGFLTEDNNPRDERVHPTQKPVAVMHWAIRQAPDTCSILDPWAGSGSTLCAASLLGRKAIGIEIEEKYCEIAAKRLAQKVLDFSE